MLSGFSQVTDEIDSDVGPGPLGCAVQCTGISTLACAQEVQDDTVWCARTGPPVFILQNVMNASDTWVTHKKSL